MTDSPETTDDRPSLRDTLLARAKAAGGAAAVAGNPFAPPSYAADEMQAAWVRGWDEVEKATP